MTEKLPETHSSYPLRRLKTEREAVLALPPEKVVDRILDAPQPSALVHSFPEEDLYLLVKDIGPEDAMPLLALASDRQVDFIFDMEVWEGDRIEPNRTQRWISLFFHSDPVHSIRWFMDREPEFYEHYLQRNIEVRIREHDQDPSEFGEGFFSVDNTFFIRILPMVGEKEAEADHRQSTLRQMLNRTADRDHVKYQKILLEAAALIPSESEEQAYRLRNVRLSEKGFLPYEEAVGIYQPLEPGDFNSRAGLMDRLRPDTNLSAPFYPATMIPSGGLFAEALYRITTPEKQEWVQIQLSSLCNRIAVVDMKQVRDRESLSAVVRKAAGYLSIGLEGMAGDDRTAGCVHTAALVSDYPLSEIFRVGFGFAQKLKWRAEKWKEKSWFKGAGLPLTFWGEQWVGVIGGLLVKRPLFYDNYRTSRLYREFKSYKEVRETEAAVNQVFAFDQMLFKMKIRIPETWDSGLLSYKNLILTLWSRHYLGLSGDLQPLGLSQFKSFFRELWIDDTKPRTVSATMKEVFLSWISDRSDTSPDRLREQVGSTFDALFAEIEEEYSRVSVEDLNSRYGTLFLVRE